MPLSIAFVAFVAPSIGAQPEPTPSPAPDPVTLASLVEDPAKPLDTWTGSISIGATMQDGNTDSRAINASVLAERRGEHDRWTGKGSWDYSETKDQATSDYVLNSRKANAQLKYDYFFTKKFYANAFAGVDTDTFADIKLRSHVGVGVGYQWREDEELKWGSEVGVAYFDEDHFRFEDSDYIAGRAANNIDWAINDKVSLANTLEAFPSLEDGDDFYGRSDTRLKSSLTAQMFAQIQWVWDYDNTPSPGLERNDHKLVLGVGWSF